MRTINQNVTDYYWGQQLCGLSGQLSFLIVPQTLWLFFFHGIIRNISFSIFAVRVVIMGLPFQSLPCSPCHSTYDPFLSIFGILDKQGETIYILLLLRKIDLIRERETEVVKTFLAKYLLGVNCICVTGWHDIEKYSEAIFSC